MNIQPIVEGFGEVAAVPVLLRRFRDEVASLNIPWDVNPPIRRKRWDLIDEAGLRKAIRLALLQPDCGAILILFDSDDDCPKELAPQLQTWAHDEARSIPCEIVMAHREYEAWFLAAIESIRNRRGVLADAISHPEPEKPRNAKSRLEERMDAGRSYSETSDQAALTAVFDMASAYASCRSFRRMVRAVGLLTQNAGLAPGGWPPKDWVGK